MKLSTNDKKRILRKLVENLKDEKSPKLDMNDYIYTSGNAFHYNDAGVENYEDSKNDCNTTMCIAGRIPLVDKQYASQFTNFPLSFSPTTQRVFQFASMAHGLLIKTKSVNAVQEFRFLFDSDWTNNREQAIKRIEYYIEHEEIHPDFLAKKFNLIMK